MPNDDWKTLRVPPEAYAAAKEQKEAAGRTWGEQIVRPDGDGGARDIYGSVDIVDVAKQVRELKEMQERNREFFERVPERTAEEIEGRFR